jgi:hypothetical protein
MAVAMKIPLGQNHLLYFEVFSFVVHGFPYLTKFIYSLRPELDGPPAAQPIKQTFYENPLQRK